MKLVSVKNNLKFWADVTANVNEDHKTVYIPAECY